MLSECGAHQQSAVAAPFNGEALRIRVALIDEPLRASVKIVENVLLPGEHTGPVPVLAVLAAAAEVGDHIDDAAIQQRAEPHVIKWGEADSVAAVTIEND